MSISIKGISLNYLSITIDANGKVKTSGNYSIIASTGKVLAKQGFNGYSDMTIDLSADSLSARDRFLDSIQRDISRHYRQE